MSERDWTLTYTEYYTWYYSSMYTMDTPPHCTHTQDWKLRNSRVRRIFKPNCSWTPKTSACYTHTVNKHRGYISFPKTVTSHISVSVTSIQYATEITSAVTQYTCKHTPTHTHSLLTSHLHFRFTFRFIFCSGESQFFIRNISCWMYVNVKGKHIHIL